MMILKMIRSDESFISLRWLKMWKFSKLTGARSSDARRHFCSAWNLWRRKEDSICEYLAANRATWHYASIRCIRVIRHLNSIYHTTRQTTHGHTYKPKRQLLNIHTLLSQLIITILEEYSSFVINRRRSNRYTMRVLRKTTAAAAYGTKSTGLCAVYKAHPGDRNKIFLLHIWHRFSFTTLTLW